MPGWCWGWVREAVTDLEMDQINVVCVALLVAPRRRKKCLLKQNRYLLPMHSKETPVDECSYPLTIYEVTPAP
jgi:hypothetical protein